MQYRIVVKTGGQHRAGTDADVYITLMGSRGNSGERELDNSGNDFERGNANTFTITTRRNLGDLRRIRIRHDNSGRHPGWYVDYITIHEETTDQMWYFPCRRWLATDEDDNLIDRLLDAS